MSIERVPPKAVYHPGEEFMLSKLDNKGRVVRSTLMVAKKTVFSSNIQRELANAKGEADPAAFVARRLIARGDAEVFDFARAIKKRGAPKNTTIH